MVNKIGKINVSIFEKELKRTRSTAIYCRILYSKQSTIFKLDVEDNQFDFPSVNFVKIEGFVREIMLSEVNKNVDLELKGISSKINSNFSSAAKKIADSAIILITILAKGNIVYEDYIKLFSNQGWREYYRSELKVTPSEQIKEADYSDLYLYKSIKKFESITDVFKLAYVLDHQFGGDYAYPEVRDELENTLIALEALIAMMEAKVSDRFSVFDLNTNIKLQSNLKDQILKKIIRIQSGIVGFEYINHYEHLEQEDMVEQLFRFTLNKLKVATK